MKIGFLGAGHLATALIKGFLKSGLDPEDIFVNSPHSAKKLSEKFSIKADSFQHLIKEADYVFLAFLPNQLSNIFNDTVEKIQADKVIISLLGPTSIDQLEKFFPENKIVRAMPNVNAEFQKSETALSFSHKIDLEDKKLVESLFNRIGHVTLIDEKNFPVFSALSGSGPAFVAYFIEALSKSSENKGLNSVQALASSLYTVQGTVDNLLQGSSKPKELIDAVASPGGSTERGIDFFEKSDFLETVDQAIERTIGNGNKE
ncbi:pyrroline-5-carboxylate reductase [Oenococcus alcoholitolerans]|uniref:pyrroline-5-carboxylate reductase n=1 Tax=Oenococcus alcoholitolerans TaxID=931074 RepID=UPI003F71A6DA